MFEKFFNTPSKYQRKFRKDIVLVEKHQKHQKQRHTIVFDVEKDIECFDFKPFTIQSVKVCDYVLVNHTDQKVLFCELKNAKDKKDACIQLLHSKYMIDCLTKFLDKNFEYKQGYLVLNEKLFNKKTTKDKLKLRCNKHFKYTYTGRTSINFNKLYYA